VNSFYWSQSGQNQGLRRIEKDFVARYAIFS
jgi:hypothetical protein